MILLNLYIKNKIMSIHENSDIWSLYEDISDTFSNDEITESKNKIINTNNEDEDIDNEMCRNCNTITDFKIEENNVNLLFKNFKFNE